MKSKFSLQELREKDLGALGELESSLVQDLFRAKFSNLNAQLRDVSKIKKIKKDIARIKTIVNLQNQSSGR